MADYISNTEIASGKSEEKTFKKGPVTASSRKVPGKALEPGVSPKSISSRQKSHLISRKIDVRFNMYVNIILSSYPVKGKIKRLFRYFRKCRGARKAWGKRHQRVFEQNLDYRTPCSQKIEMEHKNLWSTINHRIDLSTLRVVANISGKADPRIVPEELFVADIEPSLMREPSISLMSNKSFYNQRFPSGKFPLDIMHKIDGHWYDNKFNRLERSEFLAIADQIKYPVVVKPTRASFGGNGVCFANDVSELISYSYKQENCIVQEKVEQHPFFKAFHPFSLNTIRVYIYRSVKDHQLHILSMDLTIGRSGLSVNNETAGGIYSGIEDHGALVGYAVDKYGVRYEKHPDTGITFDKIIPDVEGLKEFSLEVGEKIIPATIIGLDVFYDKNGEWRMLEINTGSHSIRSAQYFGKPFFGTFTGEVIDYCKKNHWALR